LALGSWNKNFYLLEYMLGLEWMLVVSIVNAFVHCTGGSIVAILHICHIYLQVKRAILDKGELVGRLALQAWKKSFWV
jgi:hypothetical protein